VERQDVRMAEAGGSLDLAEESVGTQRCGQLGPEHLDGHLAAMLQVVGQVDGGHATSAELALDRVSAGKGGPKLV
jgi:hypothetical protein